MKGTFIRTKRRVPICNALYTGEYLASAHSWRTAQILCGPLHKSNKSILLPIKTMQILPNCLENKEVIVSVHLSIKETEV